MTEAFDSIYKILLTILLFGWMFISGHIVFREDDAKLSKTSHLYRASYKIGMILLAISWLLIVILFAMLFRFEWHLFFSIPPLIIFCALSWWLFLKKILKRTPTSQVFALDMLFVVMSLAFMSLMLLLFFSFPHNLK